MGRETIGLRDGMSGGLPARHRRKQIGSQNAAASRVFDLGRIVSLACPFGSRKPAFRFPFSDCLIGHTEAPCQPGETNYLYSL